MSLKLLHPQRKKNICNYFLTSTWGFVYHCGKHKSAEFLKSVVILSVLKDKLSLFCLGVLTEVFFLSFFTKTFVSFQSSPVPSTKYSKNQNAHRALEKKKQGQRSPKRTAFLYFLQHTTRLSAMKSPCSHSLNQHTYTALCFRFPHSFAPFL